MHFVEVALQGVRGFSPTVRQPLQTGYVVLQPPGGGRAPLGAVLGAVLYPDGRGGDASLKASPEGAARVAVALVGQDHLTWRVVRELGGAGVLQRLSRAGQTMETVTQHSVEMAQALRSQGGLPTRTAFEQLCVLSAAQRPSVQRVARPAPSQAAAPSLASQGPVAPAADVPAAQARAQQLEAELQQARQVEQLQYEADGVASEIFGLESALQALEGPRQALAQAEAGLKAAPTAKALGLPEDILERIQRYPQAVRRRDEALARLEAEKQAGTEQEGGPAPLLRNSHFWAAVGAGVVLLAAAVALPGSLRYLALLDIPVFGYAALLALRYVEDLQATERVGRRGSMLEVREKKLLEDFEAEAGPVARGMRQLGLSTPEELALALEQRPRWEAEVERLRAALAMAESEPQVLTAGERRAELVARQEALHAQLEAQGAYVRDVREVERELGRVRESIALALQGGAPAPGATGAPAGGGELVDPTPALLALAADVLMTDVPTMAGLVKDRVQQYFAALTEKRYQALELAPNGAATVQGPTGRVAASLLPARDLDLLFLSLRLTLVERLSARSRMPLVVEDLTGLVDEVKMGLLGRMLKHLGTVTQVLHVTSNTTFVPLSDLTGTL